MESNTSCMAYRDPEISSNQYRSGQEVQFCQHVQHLTICRLPCRTICSGYRNDPSRGKHSCRCQATQHPAVNAAAAPAKTKTVKIGTRGSPLAMAQAYLTKQLLQVWGNIISLPIERSPIGPLASCCV